MGTEKWKNRSKRPEERAYECKPYIQTIERREKAGDETKRESRKGGTQCESNRNSGRQWTDRREWFTEAKSAPWEGSHPTS